MAILKCDICGGALQMQSGGQSAACTVCGMTYSVERLREIVQGSGGAVQTPSAPAAQPATNPDLQYMDIRDNVFVKYTGRAKHVKIPDGVREIEKEAFCPEKGKESTLESVEIPDRVTRIGDSAFESCANLTTVTIPSGLISIGRCAFAGCKSLTNIIVDSNNLKYKSIEGNLYSKDGTVLIQYAAGKTNTSFSIPVGVKGVGNGAFYHCLNLKTVTIPNSVTSIGDYAFIECTYLINITIPNSVISIGDYAFSYCTSLTNVTIPGSVKNFGYSAFLGCRSLESVTILSGTSYIGDHTFYDCRKLTNVTFYGTKDEWRKNGNYWKAHIPSKAAIQCKDGIYQ